jgi:Zn-dependent protease with chaperone function
MRPARINPFIFPADTDFRFGLLIAAIIGASLFVYQSLYNAISRAEFRRFALQCDFDKACFEPYERQQAAWMLGGVFLLFAVAGIIYWLTPAIKIWRKRLTRLQPDDAPELLAYLADLCQEAGLLRQPDFFLDAASPLTSGVVFGRLGRYHVLLPGGLVVQYATDRPTFRAVMMHELAHIKNADVDKTYFTVSIWLAFVACAWIPFAISLVFEVARFGLDELGFVLGIGWRSIALAGLVYWLRNRVLQAREFYADVRASTWPDTLTGLERVLALAPGIKPWWVAMQAHPNPQARRRVLADTHPLFQMGLTESFAAGLAMAVAYEHCKAWLMLLFPASQENLAYWLAALVFAPLAAGIVGLGVWRRHFAAQWLSTSSRGAGRMGLALALGLIFGQFLSFRAALGFPFEEINLLSLLMLLGLSLIWGLSLAVGLFLLLRWISASAAVWIPVITTPRALRLGFYWGSAWAGCLLTVAMGCAFYLKDIEDIFILNMLDSPISVVLQIVRAPLTFFVLFSLWAYPLSAWFWRKQVSYSPGWAFLDSPAPEVHFPTLPPLRPGLSIVLGAAGGILFFVLMGGILFLLHSILPEVVQAEAERPNIFLGSAFALAILIQFLVGSGAAVITRQAGWAHGIAAAFVTGWLMALGTLVWQRVGYCVEPFTFDLGHACTEPVDLEFVRILVGSLAGLGTILTIPIVSGLSVITGWVHRLKG